MINQLKKQHNKAEQAISNLDTVRSSMEVIRAMLNVGWQLKVIANGNLIKLELQIDSIEKQTIAWQQWFIKNSLIEYDEN